MTPDFDIASLFRRRAAAEVALLASAAPSHTTALNVCRAVGVTHHDFAADDTRLLFLALEHARLWPRDRAAWACAAALRRSGQWSAAAGPNPGPLWHEAGLVRLFCGRYDGAAVRRQALLVVELSRMGREVERASNYIAAVVAGTAEEAKERKAG